MHIQRVFPVLILTCLCACTSGLKLVNIDGEIPHGPYVGGMHGVENLTFDGAGALFVTGLDGMIYRVEPTNDPFRGTITARKKLGVICYGIEVGPDGLVYVGVKDEKGVSRIGKIDKDLNHITYLTEHIPGLNGFEQSQGYLYYTSSNGRHICSKGKIYRVRFGEDENFKHPEIVVDKAGLVNGLAFSPDQTILYYTETLNGVWAYDLATHTRCKIYKPAGLRRAGRSKRS